MQYSGEGLADVERQFDEERGPAAGWRSNPADENAVPLIHERLAAIRFADRQQPEIAGLGVGRLPEAQSHKQQG